MGSRKKSSRKKSSKKKNSNKKTSKTEGRKPRNSSNPKIDKLQEQARLMEQRLAKLRGTMDKEKTKRESLAGVAKPKQARARKTRPPSAKARSERPGSATSQASAKTPEGPTAQPPKSAAKDKDDEDQSQESAGKALVAGENISAPAPRAPVIEYEELSLGDHMRSNRDEQRPQTASTGPSTATSRAGAKKTPSLCYVAPVMKPLSAFNQAANWWLAKAEQPGDDDEDAPGSLFNGTYDAKAGQKEFLEARREFVNGGDSDKNTEFVGGGSLLDGPEFDEEENKRQFQEARQAWLNNADDAPTKPTPAPATAPHTTSTSTNVCCYQCYQLVDATSVVTLDAAQLQKLRVTASETVKFCSKECKSQFTAASEVLRADRAPITSKTKIASKSVTGEESAVSSRPSGEIARVPEISSAVNCEERDRRLELQRSLAVMVEGQGEEEKEDTNAVVVEFPED